MKFIVNFENVFSAGMRLIRFSSTSFCLFRLHTPRDSRLVGLPEHPTSLFCISGCSDIDMTVILWDPCAHGMMGKNSRRSCRLWPGLNPSRGFCVVFLGKTPFPVPLSTLGSIYSAPSSLVFVPPRTAIGNIEPILHSRAV